ncbi:MAG: hypothetical protein WBA02_17380 [Jannaschia helgolandensis]|uniref:hypothetical protein n=1 Tax=Jannaschia helgolandensis TaxID=188906 RepID=UPI003C74FE17
MYREELINKAVNHSCLSEDHLVRVSLAWAPRNEEAFRILGYEAWLYDCIGDISRIAATKLPRTQSDAASAKYEKQTATKSALQTHISAKTNDRFRPVKQASAKSSIKHPDLFLVALT